MILNVSCFTKIMFVAANNYVIYFIKFDPYAYVFILILLKSNLYDDLVIKFNKNNSLNLNVNLMLLYFSFVNACSVIFIRVIF
ncbi:hypothetical protein MADA3029_350026 [Vibrio nigripulchritudo MADA3029]|nr:hypothetical protein VIBNIMADA3020_680026 [Vibrio nigripulchritudo MADA3020]CCN56183.1 hypothetical protein VIBNIMADA3021_90026 [Vibrio nigripulchritudo MADA3021]CCN59118.1 hypothetical protein MADA3029_350026 [Vibrio nigripulchritudo MADA3029]